MKKIDFIKPWKVLDTENIDKTSGKHNFCHFSEKQSVTSLAYPTKYVSFLGS